MPYIERDAKRNIKGMYRQPQPGRAEELLEDNDPAVLAFQARLKAASDQWESRKAAVLADPAVPQSLKEYIGGL